MKLNALSEIRRFWVNEDRSKYLIKVPNAVFAASSYSVNCAITHYLSVKGVVFACTDDSTASSCSPSFALFFDNTLHTHDAMHEIMNVRLRIITAMRSGRVRTVSLNIWSAEFVVCSVDTSRCR